MPAMTIVPDVERDGFPAMRGLTLAHDDTAEDAVSRGELIHLTSAIEVGGLEGGMESGKPSVAFCFTLPDGRVVIAETSLALFTAAARALEVALTG